VLNAISAIPLLQDLDCKLDIFGSVVFKENELDAELRKLGLSERVVVHGWRPLESLMTDTLTSSVGLVLYDSATLNTANCASATNKLFEYAARGIPAVVPDRSDFREFFAQEEWVAYADPTSPQSIASSIRHIFQHRDRYRHMCRAARDAFEQRYNYERVFGPVLQRLLEHNAEHDGFCVAAVEETAEDS
jgi:glycosyltransferase involved in cell wall biosynthesis